jgi:ABC-type dipeptide/oligopeptide/nickel transport system ATPase component
MRDSGRPFLSVRDLKTYFFAQEGTSKAVDGLDLDISAGQTLGIVGESGCGKSVTAKSILRIVERPGRIEKSRSTWPRWTTTEATCTPSGAGKSAWCFRSP